MSKDHRKEAFGREEPTARPAFSMMRDMHVHLRHTLPRTARRYAAIAQINHRREDISSLRHQTCYCGYCSSRRRPACAQTSWLGTLRDR